MAKKTQKQEYTEEELEEGNLIKEEMSGKTEETEETEKSSQEYFKNVLADSSDDEITKYRELIEKYKNKKLASVKDFTCVVSLNYRVTISANTRKGVIDHLSNMDDDECIDFCAEQGEKLTVGKDGRGGSFKHVHIASVKRI